MKKLLLFIIILFGLLPAAYSNDIQDEIVSALSTGNATKLATYFNKSIELTLLNNEEIYSKAQAEMIMRDFFVQHPPTKFSLLHQGGKDTSRYAIGSLVCGTITYRVTLLIKSEEGKSLIHQLRIENNNVE